MFFVVGGTVLLFLASLCFPPLFIFLIPLLFVEFRSFKNYRDHAIARHQRVQHFRKLKAGRAFL